MGSSKSLSFHFSQQYHRHNTTRHPHRPQPHPHPNPPGSRALPTPTAPLPRHLGHDARLHTTDAAEEILILGRQGREPTGRARGRGVALQVTGGIDGRARDLGGRDGGREDGDGGGVGWILDQGVFV